MSKASKVHALLNEHASQLPYPAAMRASERAACSEATIALTAGQPHLMPPPPIVEAMRNELLKPEGHRYPPSGGLIELRTARAAAFSARSGLRCDPDQVLITCGARQALAMLFEVLLTHGDEVIIPIPFWPSFPPLVQRSHGSPILVCTEQQNDYKLTPELLEQALSDRTKLLVLTSPNNPTGAIYSASELTALANVLRTHSRPVMVIADEVYSELAFHPHEAFAVATYFQDIPVATVSSWSKSYSLAGARVGSIVSEPELISTLLRLQAQTAYPARMGQIGALASYNNNGVFPGRLATYYANNWHMVAGELAKLPPGIRFTEPKGGLFVFIDLRGARLFAGILQGDRIGDWLLRSHSLGVVDGRPFGIPGSIRISLAAPRDQISEGFGRLVRALTTPYHRREAR